MGIEKDIRAQITAKIRDQVPKLQKMKIKSIK